MILNSKRCLQIRCMSQACKESLELLFGHELNEKSILSYPRVSLIKKKINSKNHKKTKFLFIGTQFELKGGPALIKGFNAAFRKNSNISLDIITHLPEKFQNNHKGITFFPANYKKEEIYKKFMSKSDILILPTYVESFGMVILEALAHGLGIISTDLYAIPEMVIDGINGIIIKPPISIWDGFLPSEHYKNLSNIRNDISNIDTNEFEIMLENSILKFSTNISFRLNAKKESRKLFIEKFQC